MIFWIVYKFKYLVIVNVTSASIKTDNRLVNNCILTRVILLRMNMLENQIMDIYRQKCNGKTNLFMKIFQEVRRLYFECQHRTSVEFIWFKSIKLRNVYKFLIVLNF